jgi:hypothetical protein
MLTKLLEGVGDRLADKWIASLLTPAFLFWAGGFIAWISKSGWGVLEKWFSAQQQIAQITIVIAVFLIVSISAIVMQRFNLLAINLLEGYWPRWLQQPKRWLIQRKTKKIEEMEKRFQELARQGIENLSAEEHDEYAILDQRLMYMPVMPDQLMPTELGNILRAAELRSQDKYGLNALICWPRLWLLLAPDVKKELTDARTILNTGANVWLWSILFLVWTIWTWWALPISLIVAFFAYCWMVNAAKTYGELLDATFDLYRNELYKLLRWPLPKNPLLERKMGKQISDYLWRGSDSSTPTFKVENK